jgi:cytochrome b subunit of formate dehydrogenase
MTFFKNPQPEDKPLFWIYLVITAFLAVGGWNLYTRPPVPDAYGNVPYNRAAGCIVWAIAAFSLACAENRRSGWFFWLKW